MLNTFDNASRSEARRLERERSIRAMRAAAADSSSARSLPVFLDEDSEGVIEECLWDSDSIHRVSSPTLDDDDDRDDGYNYGEFSGLTGQGRLSTASGRFLGWGGSHDNNNDKAAGDGWGSSVSTRSLGFGGGRGADASSSVRSLGTGAGADVYGGGGRTVSMSPLPKKSPGAKLLRGLKVPAFGPRGRSKSDRHVGRPPNIAPAGFMDDDDDSSHHRASPSRGGLSLADFRQGRSRSHYDRSDPRWHYEQQDNAKRCCCNERAARSWLRCMCALIGAVALIGGCVAALAVLVSKGHAVQGQQGAAPSPVDPIATELGYDEEEAIHTELEYGGDYDDDGDETIDTSEPLSPPPEEASESPAQQKKDPPPARDHDATVQLYARRIIEAGVTSPNAFGLTQDGEPVPSLSIDDLATPQRVALEWLTFLDPMALDPEDDLLLQRYGLAVLWFAAHPDLLEIWKGGAESAAELQGIEVPLGLEGAREWKWKESEGWMSGGGICSWHGVRCQPKPGPNGSDNEVTSPGFEANDDGGPFIRGSELAEEIYDDNGQVTSLLLDSNNIGGSLPDEIFSALTDMETILLSHNRLRGPLSASIGKLKRLRSLDLNDNELSGSLPVEIGDLKAITDLELSENTFSGTVPGEALARLGDTLIEISLYNNDLTGTVPSELGQLHVVQNLYLDSNKLTGPIPTELADCEELKDLRLRDNALTGELSDELFEGLNLLEVLYLDSNELAGDLPDSMGDLSNLKELTLFDNSLQGSLPEAWYGLTQLSHLYLDGNGGLTGTIPTSWCSNLNQLRHLYLSHNRLQGSIPSEIGLMMSLEKLHLRKNQLTGEIPTQLGQLLGLAEMTVEGNELRGNVPEEVCMLRPELEPSEGARHAGELEVLTVSCDEKNEQGQGRQRKGRRRRAENDMFCDCCTECHV